MELARRMWTGYESVHGVTYFAPEARAAYEAAGLRGYWRGYFAGRAAPLGPVGSPPVAAAFCSFAPGMVARALPDVWARLAPDDPSAGPARALDARTAGAVAALRRILAGYDVTEAADLLHEATSGLDHAGRVLAAANAALPAATDPLARLWQAATLLREHRGDGHVAALVAAGLTGRDALVLRAGLGAQADGAALSRDVLQPIRGWTDEEWRAAARDLEARGWLRADGVATPAGAAAYADVEAATDRAAAAPWVALGSAGTGRLAELLAPLARACRAELPVPNPTGLPEVELP